MCFLPGVLALGSHNGLGAKHMNLAKDLLETCNRMYTDMPTGLSPEIVYFNMGSDGNNDIIVKVNIIAHNVFLLHLIFMHDWYDNK